MQLKLKTKIFADGAEKAGMLELHNNPLISGFTTNPTLMRKAGIKDYKAFAQDILKFITDKPVSFEVFSDDFNEMENQATEIAKWGSNVIVKIPITNTKAESSVNLISKLSSKGIKINATAMMTVDQVISVLPALSEGPGGFVSIFAGRVADAGVDPVPIMKEVLNLLKNYPNIELIWASPRELFNIVQANKIGCHIITVTNDILKKLPTIGKDLTEFSLDTVKMFFNDASAAGYTIKHSSEKVLL
jgi:transaldolase